MKGGMTPPMITNSISNGAVIVRHREYLRDILNTTDFKNISFDLNPGITSTFPWLSQIAMSFSQYRFRGLVFEFKTTSSDTVLSSAASTSLGTVVMATQYNALDTPFTNKFEMENWEYSVSTKPSLSCMHPIECAKSQTPVSLLWTRNGPKPGDERLYDLGNFNIATVGMQGEPGLSAIGELWCSYEIEFFKPQFIEDGGAQTAYFTGSMLNNYPSSTVPLGGSGPIIKIDPKTSNWDCYLDPTDNASRIYVLDSIAKRILISIVWSWSSNVTFSTTPTLTSHGAAFVGWLQDTTLADPGHAYTTLRSGTIVNNGWGVLQGMFEITSDEAYFTVGSFSYTPNTTCSGFNLVISEIGPDTCGSIGGF